MEPALAIFGPLLGHCFAATVAPNVVDRHCFASVYELQHVRDTHVVIAGDKQVYAGETLYSFDGQGIEFTYVNSTGGVGHGKATIDGGVLTFSGSMKPSPDKAAVPISGSWKIGERGYDVENEGQPVRHFAPAD